MIDKYRIIIKDVIQSENAITSESGEILSNKLSEIYQEFLKENTVETSKEEKLKINLSFEGISELTPDFLYKSLESFKINEIVKKFVFTKIETKEILDVIKLTISNLIMLSNQNEYGFKENHE